MGDGLRARDPILDGVHSHGLHPGIPLQVSGPIGTGYFDIVCTAWCRLPRGTGVARLRDAFPEWSRQFEALGLNPQ